MIRHYATKKFIELMYTAFDNDGFTDLSGDEDIPQNIRMNVQKMLGTIAEEVEDFLKESEESEESESEDIESYIYEIENTEEILIKEVPLNVDEFINDIRSGVTRHIEYIGLEVGCTRYSEDDDLVDALKEHFGPMGLHVQQYSSGNIRFRIEKRPQEGLEGPIVDAVNRYYEFLSSRTSRDP